MFQLLEILGVLFVVYIVTQIFIPMVFPKDFERNWIFKRKKPLDEKVQEIGNKKARLNTEIEETKDEMRNLSKKVDAADKDLDNIKNS